MRLIVGISGASGAAYGIRLLEVLRALGVESHLVLTSAAKETIKLETPFVVEQVQALASQVYAIDDIGAAVASGSFRTAGMVVVPCTIKTLSGIANSYTENLLVRAADVTLKEKRKLILVVRETPLHKGHLRLMSLAADMGAHILPPVPSFYHMPKTIDDIIDQTIGKIFDYMGIQHKLFQRWNGDMATKRGGNQCNRKLSVLKKD